MQAPMMPTPSGGPSQPPASFQPQSDPSASPSISTNPPPQPPPLMPAYASINSAPYQSAAPAGPSNYPVPNGHYMYQQQHNQHQQHQHQQPYYPPQHHQPRHTQSGPYNTSNYNRYQEQSYVHQPHLQQYAPAYHQNPYGGYPHIPMGGGGPGPATLQNGYGGYQSEAYHPAQYGAYPQHYPAPPEAFQQYPAQPISNEDLDGQSIQSNNPQLSRPPPNFPPEPSMNGHAPPPQQHPSFHPAYPPNHPYAYGVGVGYPTYHHTPMGYSGYGGYNEGYIPAPVQSGRSAGKGLNPAAAGFSYSPSGSGSRTHSQPSSTPVPNGDSSIASEREPSFPSIAQASEKSTLLSNGHDETSITRPSIERTAEPISAAPSQELARPDESHANAQKETAPSLRSPSPAPAPEANLSASVTTASTSTPAMSSSPTTATSSVSAQTPKAAAVDDASFPVSPTTDPSQSSGLTFVGEGLVGLTSPSLTKSRKASASSAHAGVRKSPSRPLVQPSSLKLIARRPETKSDIGNTYASELKSLISEAVSTESAEVDAERIWRSKKGKNEPSGKRTVYSIGVSTKKSQRRSVAQEAESLSFGSLESAELAAVAALPDVSSVPQVSEPKTPVPDAASLAPVTGSSTPQPKPVTKPFSWAAAVRGASAAPSPAPSKVASPAKSTTSLPQEAEAGPSRLPSTEPSSTPPRPATGPEKKAPFNYAAAAASGAPSPQEELARLLSEGLKGKGKETQATLPRGLINTGNMCFANTILQVLVYCSPFTELFEELGKRLKADLARKTPLLEAMIIFLREFNAPVSATGNPAANGPIPNGTSTPKGKQPDPRREAFIPENVYDAMKENKRFDSMRRGHQEDAEEYLGFFLNTLHEELLYVLSRSQPLRPVQSNGSTGTGESERQIERPVSPGAGDESGWLEVGKKQKTHVVRATETRESAVSRLFGGTLRSLLRTPGQKDSVTVEPYQPLQLDIQAPSVLDITDALRHMTEPETVPGVWSAARGMEVDATKQVFIETCPQVLILHLKRFVYDAAERAVVKRNKPIAYGTELVIPPEIISPGRRSSTPIKYRLFGVVYHHGSSASGGHYTVSVSRQGGSGWIHFDDENVLNVPKEDVVVSKEEAESGQCGLVGGRERTAYLLFYQRVR